MCDICSEKDLKSEIWRRQGAYSVLDECWHLTQREIDTSEFGVDLQQQVECKVPVSEIPLDIEFSNT